MQRVRFLPAASLPDHLVEQLLSALDQLVLLMLAEQDRRPRESQPLHEVVAAARAVRGELARHRGAAGERCLVTKEAVFEVSSTLSSAAEALSKEDFHAAAFVLRAVDDRLLEQIVEAQPLTPA